MVYKVIFLLLNASQRLTPAYDRISRKTPIYLYVSRFVKCKREEFHTQQTSSSYPLAFYWDIWAENLASKLINVLIFPRFALGKFIEFSEKYNIAENEAHVNNVAKIISAQFSLRRKSLKLHDIDRLHNYKAGSETRGYKDFGRWYWCVYQKEYHDTKKISRQQMRIVICYCYH